MLPYLSMSAGWLFIYRAFKFGIVGCVGMGVDFGLTWLFKEKLRLDKFFANAIGFTMAVVSNYILNRIWTFESHSTKIMRQFLLFLLVSLVGLAINTVVIYALHEKKQHRFYRSKVVATIVVALWNFFANYFLTFRF